MVHRSIEGDKLIDKKFEVFNHGHVRLVDYMGTDASIVQAARVSYGKGTTTPTKDRSLIRYLMSKRHTSPFEMVEFKFHVKLPIFIARQWIRHRTASVNEYSGRYSVMKAEFYRPDPSQLRPQSTDNKQGRADEEVSDELKRAFALYQEKAESDVYRNYEHFLDEGLAREISRINLPLSMYTEWYWKIDLHNLLHFLKLRQAKNATWEFQQYANIIADIVKAVCPITFGAFEDYVRNAVTFSVPETQILKEWYKSLKTIELSDGWAHTYGMSKREMQEFIEKLKNL